MGCHTWFCKPVTIKEQVEMMRNAPKDITEIKKYDEIVPELDKCIFILEHIQDKTVLNIKNVF